MYGFNVESPRLLPKALGFDDDTCIESARGATTMTVYTRTVSLR